MISVMDLRAIPLLTIYPLARYATLSLSVSSMCVCVCGELDLSSLWSPQ